MNDQYEGLEDSDVTMQEYEDDYENAADSDEEPLFDVS